MKLINFQMATKADSNTKLSETVGLPYYIAPEILRKKYDNKCDLWSIGIVMHMILTGHPPFEGQNGQEIKDKILKQDLKFKGKEYEILHESALDLLRKLLEKNPMRRPSAP